jgi:hypothetical protein
VERREREFNTDEVVIFGDQKALQLEQYIHDQKTIEEHISLVEEGKMRKEEGGLHRQVFLPSSDPFNGYVAGAIVI